MDPVVRAAGGIVWRDRPDGTREVLLVHRAAYDDWSFPKGKAEPGESDAACALREVAEETGLACELGDPAGDTRYRDGKGREKLVRYFAMRPLGDRLSLLHEVDDARWLAVEEACRWLTYERDRGVLCSFAGGRSTG